MGRRIPLVDIYKERFFARRDSLSWRAKPVCDAIVTVINPKSVIDVGCGIGDYVAYFANNFNVSAWGIEGSINAVKYFKHPHIFVRDLRDEIKLDMSFDLVVCFEVAEHIEPKYANQFLRNLVTFSDHILMSAASPNQGGHYHVNCQPREYWVKRMNHFGYKHNDIIVNMIRTLWAPWQKKKEMSSYYHNLFYFEKGEKNGR